MSAALFGERDAALLLALLRTPTVAPLEVGCTGPPPRLREAGELYAAAAAELGMEVVRHAAATPAQLTGSDVPLAVRDAIAADPGFLDCQPSLVLRLGAPLAVADTVMLNVHLDTVAGLGPVSFDGERFVGRGAIDAKGPACALLAGIRGAIAAEPALGRDVGVLVQAVAGEEGGAMGAIGTAPLVAQGLHGRLNVFCEPTRLRWLARASASMTARIRVAGDDATDDRPERGHNASVLLGFLAQHLAGALTDAGVERFCVAGLQTGPLHNRVYGSGALLVNMSYERRARGRELETAFEAAVAAGIAEFRRRFAARAPFARTADDAAAITRVEWVKRRLPALDSRDPWSERLLELEAGLERWPADEPAFTCDAIWMDGIADVHAIVLGPGDLAANRAHADGEFATRAELERFAGAVARLLVAFARARTPTGARA